MTASGVVETPRIQANSQGIAQWGPALAGAPTFGHLETDGTERFHPQQLGYTSAPPGIMHPLRAGWLGHRLKPAPTESNGSLAAASDGGFTTCFSDFTQNQEPTGGTSL